MEARRIDQVRLFLITGDPGSGKTTAVSRIILGLRSDGYTVGGFLTREIRSHGVRTGFMLVDTSTDEATQLATVGANLGPSVGRYRVNLNTLATVAVRALKHAAASSDVMICDEMGPMELFSPEFRKAVPSFIMNSSKPCICVIHNRLADPLIEKIKSDRSAKLFEVTVENRGDIPQLVLGEIQKSLEARGLL